MSIVELVKNAGVVGAGGAGFPTHVKIDAKADIVIANGAECEPLLQSDQRAMDLYTDQLIAGLRLVMQQVGAERGFIAVKEKHHVLVQKIRESLATETSMELLPLENMYPAGDEHVLVNLATGRVVPEGGIPLNVGVVVTNVATLINIYYASQGQPVIERLVTVIGEVANPAVVRVPIGTPVSTIISALGGMKSDDCVVISGGPMMGEMLADLNSPITKLTSGLIVLPRNHKVVTLKSQKPQNHFIKARSTCCQCNYCTLMCPRYQLGHNLEPHKVMRALGGAIDERLEDFTQAYLCSECGICGFYACVHELMPIQINRMLKQRLRQAQIPNLHQRTDVAKRNPVLPTGIPADRLLRRIGLGAYDVKTPLDEVQVTPREVFLPLRQHIGAPAEARVQVGDRVERGQLIGEIPAGSLGARIHASISGEVVAVTDTVVIRA